MSHSEGYDGIPTKHLKLINKDLSKYLTLIVNQSLNSGNFPDKLKIVKVTPIYKKGDKQIITNYRPISVLPVIFKIFDLVIHGQLVNILSQMICLARNSMGLGKIHVLSLQH